MGQRHSIVQPPAPPPNAFVEIVSSSTGIIIAVGIFAFIFSFLYKLLQWYNRKSKNKKRKEQIREQIELGLLSYGAGVASLPLLNVIAHNPGSVISATPIYKGPCTGVPNSRLLQITSGTAEENTRILNHDGRNPDGSINV
ncbi:membrane fusion protein p15 [Baboon orthoreovirus]|uniref:Membrane fusion protein p15 n=1 Tax=Baboon orthoreovirus TaxID=75888 RepID=Q918V6_9REOV|nr:membrane fusion protein p15 [Baboon orthoreovirus]AAL01373.1 membrane fusion protein p15 [Baboon orthoreovirus]